MNRSVIWIMGPIRSGTNWIADLCLPVSNHIFKEDEIYRDLNNRKKPIKQFFNDNLVFKFNTDKDHIDQLFDLSPDSKLVFVIRDGREVCHSMAYPSSRSYPTRIFPYIEEAKKQGIHPIYAAARSWVTYMTNGDGYYHDFVLDKYPGISYILRYENLISDFDNEYLEFLNFLNLPIDNIKFKKIISPIKTPSQDKWLNWSNSQKDAFKSFDEANELLIKNGYASDNNW